MLNLQTLHRRAARVLPEVVQTSGLLHDAIEPNQLAAMLFPLRRQSDGAIRFRLSSATLNALGTQPLACLQQATLARAALGRMQRPFTYRAWRVARLPASWLQMLADTDSAGACGFADAYFTTKTDGKAMVVIVPDARIVVYFWRH